jgi:chemotaxis protein MotB
MALPEDDPPPGVPEWVVTYGDMMSLLLTFFIMLVSMSKLKQDGEVRQMMDAIRAAFGSTDGLAGVPGLSPQLTSAFNQPNSQGMRQENGTKRAGRKTSGPGGANRPVESLNRGTVVTLGGPAQFGRFEATLTDELKSSLDAIARVVERKPNRLMIRGHASPEPLPPDFDLVVDGLPVRDVWDLSFARARAVADYLASRGIDRRRLIVNAAGDTEPRTKSRNVDDQRQNRRVDVFVVDSYITPPQ